MTEPLPEQTCTLCGTHSRLIAAQLGVCPDCIRNRPQEALTVADEAHAAARRLFGLPHGLLHFHPMCSIITLSIITHLGCNFRPSPPGMVEKR